MKVLIVTYNCKPGMRDEFINAIKDAGLDQKCREEEGNIRYAYGKALEDENKLFLLELWESTEALEEHKQMEHFLEIGKLKEIYVEETTIEVYEG